LKINTKRLIILFFGLLLVLILSSKTVHKVCTICGVQDFERSLFGKTVEWISNHEVDDYGTYAKWQEEHDTVCVHKWKVLNEFSEELLKQIDSLQ